MYLVLTGAVYDDDGDLSVGIPMQDGGSDQARNVQYLEGDDKESPRALTRYLSTGSNCEQNPGIRGGGW